VDVLSAFTASNTNIPLLPSNFSLVVAVFKSKAYSMTLSAAAAVVGEMMSGSKSDRAMEAAAVVLVDFFFMNLTAIEDQVGAMAPVNIIGTVVTLLVVVGLALMLQLHEVIVAAVADEAVAGKTLVTVLEASVFMSNLIDAPHPNTKSEAVAVGSRIKSLFKVVAFASTRLLVDVSIACLNLILKSFAPGRIAPAAVTPVVEAVKQFVPQIVVSREELAVSASVVAPP